MPMYSYYCHVCKDEVDIIRMMADRDEPVDCDECWHERKRAIKPPGLVWSPTTGRKYS